MKRMNYGWTNFCMISIINLWDAKFMMTCLYSGQSNFEGLQHLDRFEKEPKLEVCEWIIGKLPKRKWNTKLILNPSIIAINTWKNIEQIFIHQHLEVCKMHFPFKPNNKTKKYGLPFTQPQVLTITHMQWSKRKCWKQKVFASFMYMCMGPL